MPLGEGVPLHAGSVGADLRTLTERYFESANMIFSTARGAA